MTSFQLTDTRDGAGVRHETRRRTLSVLRRTPLTDTLVRFTLGGDLDGFTNLGPADHVKLFFATDDGPAMRDYTPAEFRPDAASGAELDIDFVVHGDAGPATRWATVAAEGDQLEIGGPRGSRLASSAWRNALLIADGAATPAVRNWIRALGAMMPVQAILFGDDPRLVDYLGAEEQHLAAPFSVPGTDGLLDAVRSHDIDADTFVFAAGEATALIPVRRWLKGEKALPKQNLSLHGYWRIGEVNLGDHAPLDPSDPD